MEIINLRTNHIEDPIGFAVTLPVFSWQIEGAIGKFQRAARIKVAADQKMARILADTGWSAELDNLASSVEMVLAPRTRYYWTVSVETDAGEVAESDVSFFETGKMEESWEAQWITCDRTDRHPIFHRDILVTKPLASARLYICGLGLYEAEVNGIRVGNEYMTPYCNNYAAWVQAQNYDVSELLQNGGRLSIMIGDGWYMGRFGFFGKDNNYGTEPKLIAEVRLQYTDGSEDVIGTDET